MSSKIEANNCFVIMNENFLLSLLLLKRTFSQILGTVIKILKCLYILRMRNVKLIINHFFYILIIQTKKNEQTKQKKTVVKFIICWGGDSKSCQIHAAHASFILIKLLFFF